MVAGAFETGREEGGLKARCKILSSYIRTNKTWDENIFVESSELFPKLSTGAISFLIIFPEPTSATAPREEHVIVPSNMREERPFK